MTVPEPVARGSTRVTRIPATVVALIRCLRRIQQGTRAPRRGSAMERRVSSSESSIRGTNRKTPRVSAISKDIGRPFRTVAADSAATVSF